MSLHREGWIVGRWVAGDCEDSLPPFLAAGEGDLNHWWVLRRVNLPRLLRDKADRKARVPRDFAPTCSVASVGTGVKGAIRHGAIVRRETAAGHLEVEHVLVVCIRAGEVRVAVGRLDLREVVLLAVARALCVIGVRAIALVSWSVLQSSSRNICCVWARLYGQPS